MFGGHGLYFGDTFFGIVSDNRLYFKTDDNTSSLYVSRGMQPFQPTAKQRLKNYYEVPADVVEERSTLVEWARQAARAGGSEMRRKSRR